MNKIFVGTEGSVDGQAALGWAADLATAVGAELVVATAWSPGFQEVPPEEYDELRAQAGRQLDDDWCAQLREAGVAYRAVVVEGDPRDALLTAAAAEAADLVVVGARGMGGRHHALHLGSVAHHLVHHTDRALAVVPVAARTSWPSPVVVGVDGSSASGQALAWAVALGHDVGAEVIATYAEHPPAEFVPHDDPKSWYSVAVKELEQWVTPFMRSDTTVERLVIDLAPGPGLAEAAHRERAGLIVVGARGAGTVTGIRLGSIALKVLHHSGLPVVVVPESAA